MHRISRAPVLSATLSRVSGWTIYLARSMISTRRQRLLRDSGRLSITRTRSPSLASFFSSCACSDVDSRMIFLYILWRRAVSIRTVIVLSAFAEMTMPWRGRGLRGRCSLAGGVSAGPSPPVRLAFSFSRRRRRAAAFWRRRSSRSATCFSIVCLSGICVLLAPDLDVDVDAALAGHGHAAGQVALRRLEPSGVLELSRRVLEAKTEV